MKIAVWHTGHEIADTVSDYCYKSLPASTRLLTSNLSEEPIKGHDIHIGYGILRGMNDVFRMAQTNGKPWFNIDKGYIGSGHFDGYYRISLRGTQHTQTSWLHFIDRERLNGLCVNFEPWRGMEYGKPVLICPPQPDTAAFFGIDHDKWLNDAVKSCCGRKHVVRRKGDHSILMDSILGSSMVVTFNSSVAWEAMRLGVPSMSDLRHSFLGHVSCEINVADLVNWQKLHRVDLFAAMAGLQLTLQEMRDGKLWQLMNRLMSGSDGTAENNRQLMFASEASRRVQNQSLTSSFLNTGN